MEGDGLAGKPTSHSEVCFSNENLGSRDSLFWETLAKNEDPAFPGFDCRQGALAFHFNLALLSTYDLLF